MTDAAWRQIFELPPIQKLKKKENLREYLRRLSVRGGDAGVNFSLAVDIILCTTTYVPGINRHAPRILRTSDVRAPHRIFVADHDLLAPASGLSIDLVETYRASPSRYRHLGRLPWTYSASW